MKNKDKPSVSRREFLQGAAAAGLGAAVAVSLPGAVTAATDKSQAQAPIDNKGYQETAHVREYYKTLSS